MIKSENLTFEYVKETLEGNTEVTKALKSVSINIEEGEFVAILGHNGSGKSTFAKCLNGLLLVKDGVLFVNGLNARNEEDVWDIRQKVGMVFQNPDNQIVATIVEDDVAFGCENLGIESDEIRERVDNALNWVGMYEHKNKAPNLLSGGQKQRVAIAGILAMKPKCIIFDESTAMLDPKGRKDILSVMHRLNKEEDITIILITHYMDEVVNADRVYVMNEGEVALKGTPKEIFSEYDKITELGLEVPIVAKIAHELRKKGIDIPKDVLEIDEMVEFLCQYK
ncbi:MAG: energy-coupling factor transporter ATPase [Lachnospirales bacterium]